MISKKATPVREWLFGVPFILEGGTKISYEDLAVDSAGFVAG